jgi:hypothetical protein
MNHENGWRQTMPEAESENEKERILHEKVIEIFERLGTRAESHAFLAHGNHNENYLVTTDVGKRVLRLENGAMFHNLKNEYETLDALPSDLGPQVFAYDGSRELMERDYLVEEFFEGKHPKETTDSLVRDMAHWFKKLHAVKRPVTDPFRPSQEIIVAAEHFRDYRDQLPAA